MIRRVGEEEGGGGQVDGLTSGGGCLLEAREHLVLGVAQELLHAHRQAVRVGLRRREQNGADLVERRACLGHVRIARGHELGEPIGAMGGDGRAQSLHNEGGGLTARVHREGDLARLILPAGVGKG